MNRTVQLLSRHAQRGRILFFVDKCLVVRDPASDGPPAAVDLSDDELREVLAEATCLPLPPSYRRNWALQHTYQPDGFLNSARLHCAGAPNHTALEQGWLALVARHPMLTAIITGSEEAPHYYLPLNPPKVELALAAEKWDVGSAPLARLSVTMAEAGGYTLELSAHPALLAEASVRELLSEYGTEFLASGTMPALGRSLAIEQRWAVELAAVQTPEARRAVEYWRGTFTSPIPRFDLYPNLPRSLAPAFAAAALHSIDISTARASLEGAAERLGGEFESAVLGALVVLLHRFTGQDEIVLGVLSAGNCLPIKVECAAVGSPSDLVAQVRAQLIAARTHGLSLAEILAALELAPTHNAALLSVAMGFGTESAAVDGEAARVVRDGFANLAIALELVAGRVHWHAWYNPAVLRPSELDLVAESYTALLDDLAVDTDRGLESYSLVSPRQRALVLKSFNATDLEYDESLCLHHWFERQVALTPAAVAVSLGTESLTYGELERRSLVLAQRLRDAGVGPESLVGIACERTPTLVVGLLAILRAGGAYVPLDPAYPAERLAYILGDSGAKWIVASAKQATALRTWVSGDVAICEIDALADRTAEPSANGPLGTAVCASNLAYVIYTSGSTGQPKGVAITHRSASALMHWAGTVYSAVEVAGVLASTSVCFDLSVFEIFFTLAQGGRVVLVDNALSLLEGDGVAEITLLNTVPSAAEALLAAGAIPPSVITINLAGEPLAPALVDRLYERTSVAKVYDLYGPSEDTTYSTFTLRGRGRPACIGRPIANTRAYVLDAGQVPVPIGVPGELYLAGHGLARGYLNRPDLTAEKFVCCPFDPTTLMYRTGDLVRWLESGELQYLGRLDRQIKLRGFRIEIGEIEAALARHPRVRDCAVICSAEPDRQLLAYYVASDVASDTVCGAAAGPLAPAELKRHLAELLPDYMIPALLVSLDALPLTPNGKIDRRALETHLVGYTSNATLTPPAGEAEQRVAELFADALGVAVSTVGAHDDFFERGGHSLSAARLAGRLSRAFGARCSAADVFRHREVAALAALLAAAGRPPRPVLAPRGADVPAYIPLAPAQERLWFLDALGAAACYNVPRALLLHGAVDQEALRAALAQVVDRHESLRTHYPAVAGRPRQVVAGTLTLDLPLVDCSAAQVAADRRAAAYQYCLEAARQPFDLAAGPLIRLALIKLDPECHVLLLNVHHIICDDWSLAVLLRELLGTAGGFLPDFEAPSLPLLQYRDYCLWQHRVWSGNTVAQPAREYWAGKLAGTPRSIDLPIDFPRSNRASHDGASTTFAIDAATTGALRELAARSGATLYMVLLAVCKAVLHRYSGKRDLCVGGVIANRQEPEVEGLIGLFVNTLALRTEFDPQAPFTALLQAVKATCLEAYAHQDTPFEQVVAAAGVEHDLSINPLFQVMVILQNIPVEEGLGPRVEPFPLARVTSKFDFTVEFVETATGLAGLIEYNTALYRTDTMERFGEHLAAAARAVAADSATAVARLEILGADERRKLLYQFNTTAQPQVGAALVHERVLAQAERTPAALAVVAGGESLTYAALVDRSLALARNLRERGVGPDVLVAVSMGRCVDLVVAILGVLRAGGAYVPLDPDYPPERLAFMLNDAGAALLLTHSGERARFDGLTDAPELICLDQPWPTAAPATVDGRQTADSLIYVIYTSGSTGRPKGAANNHRGFANLTSWYTRELGMSAADRVLVISNPSFDLTQKNLLAPLMVGAAVYLSEYYDPREIRRIIENCAITWINCAPSSFYGLLEGDLRPLSSLRQVVLGGEPIQLDRLKAWYRAYGSCAQLYNSYGPTEASDVVTAFKCTTPMTSFPIGRPIQNTRIYILDALDQPVPIGVPGELCIAGEGVSRGYLNQPELTAKHFVPDPFAPGGGAMYRSGDLARWLADGNIEYLGRIDTQIKIRGMRIELSEIEAALARHPAVREAVVVAQGVAESRRLVAFYQTTAEAPAPIPREELRTHLAAVLPDYMIPGNFAQLPQIPFTPNGKVDRRALEAMEVAAPEAADRRAPSSELERRVCAVWARELDLAAERIGVDANFFDLGGNSLNVFSVSDALSKLGFGEFAAVDLFRYPTVRSITAYLGARDIDAADDSMPVADCASAAPDAPDAPAVDPAAIAVIGLSCRVADADDHWQFWDNLLAKRESVRHLTPTEARRRGVPEAVLADPAFVAVAPWLEGKELFDPEFFHISGGNAALMDPQLRQLLLHAWRAVEDAGLKPGDIPNTGVFVSCSNNAYLALSGRQPSEAHVLQDSEEYVGWTLAQPGTYPTMISYQLGFKGPSLFLHSNCSSSLTALHAALQNLRSGDCDAALVGAAALAAFPSAGYLHERGMNLSSDGHLRAFDADADGMVEGEGVGMVLLKRAGDAIAAGDPIYCLLRDVAVNNDGSEKAGFYAPGVKGQAAVIERTLARAGVEATSIGYVEAHGTGTALGDPIEIAALTDVYGRSVERRQFCAIGSVKSNLGHLDAAAGLVGCIKLALGLRHHTFPPTVNYRCPNPQIDFARTPFYVLDEARAWMPGAVPERAALSAFGIGGTNAHALFEEYLAPATVVAAGVGVALCPLSAERPAVLREYADKLRTFLVGRGADLELGAVAYTLQTGRVAMRHRVAFVVRSVVDLCEALQCFAANAADPRVVVADEQAPALSELLAGDDDFDQLVAQWLVKGKLHKLAQVWVGGAELDWSLLHGAGRPPRRVNLPTYPFALTPHWLLPSAPAAAPIARLHPMLHRNTSSLMGQRYSASFGERDFFLRDHRIGDELLFPAVASLEMAYAAVIDATPPTARTQLVEIDNVVWAAPVVARGDIELDIDLTAEGTQAVDFEVAHVVSRTATERTAEIHCTGRVRFLGPEPVPMLDLVGIAARTERRVLAPAELYEAMRALGTHFGPGFRGVVELRQGVTDVLATVELPAAVVDSATSFALHPTLIDSALQAGLVIIAGVDALPSVATLPFALESLRIYGPCLPRMRAWVRFSPGSHAQAAVVKLDIDLCDSAGEVRVALRGFSSRRRSSPSFAASAPAFALELAVPVWTPSATGCASTRAFTGDRHLLLCGTRAAIERAGGSDDGSAVFELEADTIDAQFMRAAAACFTKLQAIIRTRPSRPVLLQVAVMGGEGQGLGAALAGLLETATLEHPHLLGQILELVDVAAQSQVRQIAATEAAAGAKRVRYSAGTRYLHAWRTAAEPEAGGAPIWREGGVYIITGGLGGIGLHFAREILAATARARVVLTGRRRVKLESIDDPRVAALLREDGVTDRLHYFPFDVTDAVETARALADISGRIGPVRGLLHAAGVLADSFILKKTAAQFASVLAPKVIGTANLDRATADFDLDFFVMFSSESSFGSLGQADYAAANCFMNEFADHRATLVAQGRRRGLSLAINWPYWAEGGMTIDATTADAVFAETGMAPMASGAGLRAFYRCIAARQPQLLVLHGVAEKMTATLARRSLLPATASRTAGAPAVRAEPRAHADLTARARDLLIDHFAVLFKRPPSQIEAAVALEEYGIDSILAIRSVNQLEARFGKLAKTLLFEYQSIDELAEYFSQHHADALNGTAAPVAAQVQLVEQWLCQELAAVFKIAPGQLEAEVPFETYGLDSILAIKLVNKLEQSVGPLSKTLFFEHANLGELAQQFALEHGEKLAEKLADAPPAAAPLAGNHAAIGAAGRRNATPATSQVAHGAGEPIAVIGLSGRYPQALDLEEFWANLRAGRDCVTPVPVSRWGGDTAYPAAFADGSVPMGGFIDGIDQFDAKFFNITPREAAVLDPQERIFLQHAWLAMEDAGYTRQTLQVPRVDDLGGQVGVYVGVMYGEYQLLGAEATLKGTPMAFAGSLADIANRVSYVLNLHGPSYTIDTMCSSSLTALHLACQDLRSGRTDMAFAGGVNLNLHPNKYLMLSSGQYLSKSGHCHSFGAGGDGYVPGEGVGVVILKRLADAERDGDKIHGLLLGSALNHGGKTNGYTVPNPQAQTSVVVHALRDAGVDPRDVSYVEAHGTGTKLGDPIEITALNHAFSQRAKAFPQRTAPAFGPTRVGSVKSNIGHCEPAAGIAGLTKVLLQIRHGEIAPSLHANELNPNIDFAGTPFQINTQLTGWERPVVDGVVRPRIAGLSSFGAGGANAHLLVAEYLAEPAARAGDDDTQPHLVVLSAKTPAQLRQRAGQLAEYLSQTSVGATERLRDIAYTLQVGREAMDHRAWTIASTALQLTARLRAFAAGEEAALTTTWVRDHKAELQQLRGRSELASEVREWFANRDLMTLGRLWSVGLALDWASLYTGEQPRRVSLPTYPFAPDRHWVSVPDAHRQLAPVGVATAELPVPVLRTHGGSDGTKLRLSDARQQPPAVPLAGKPRLALSPVAATEAVTLTTTEPGVAVLELAPGLASLDVETVIDALRRALVLAAALPDASVLCLRGVAPALLAGRDQLNTAIASGLYQALIEVPYPVVAEVAGGATGGGLLLVALCDFLVGSDTASFAYSWPERALVPSAAEEALLAERFGALRARDLLYFSRRRSGAELRAAGWGAVFVPGAELAANAAAIVAELVDKPGTALRLLKQHLARDLRERVAALAPAPAEAAPTEPALDAAPGSTVVALSALTPHTLQVELAAVANAADLKALVADLTALTGWLEKNYSVHALVLNSHSPSFLPEGLLAEQPALFSELKDALVGLPVPVVVALPDGASGSAWWLALLADGCVYSRAARVSAGAVAAPVADVAQEALLRHRLGERASDQLLLTRAEYEAAELQRLEPSVAVADNAVQHAAEMVSIIAELGASGARAWRRRAAAALAVVLQSPVVVEAVVTVAEPQPWTARARSVPLASPVVSATLDADGVLLVKMEDRAARNMHSQAILAGMLEVFERIEQLDDCRVVVLTGYDTYFSTGGTRDDLIEIQQGRAKFTDIQIYHLALNCTRPVVAAMQGHAIGAGLALGLFADEVILGAEARYLSPYMNYGFTPGAGATLVVPARFGYDLARESLLLAREFTGTALAQRGAQVQVLPRQQVLPAALALARSIARQPLAQLKALKQRRAAALLRVLPAVYELELAMHERTYVGQTAVLERIERRFLTEAPADVDRSIAGSGAVAAKVDPAAAPDEVAIEAQLVSLLAEELHLTTAEIDPETHFVELGLDSIYGVTWMRKVNETFGLELETVQIYSHPSPREFSRFVGAALGQRGAIAATVQEVPVEIAAEAATSADASVRERLLDELREMLADELHMPSAEVDEDAQFVELGLDSIYGVTWVRQINARYQLNLDAVTIYSHPTLTEFARHLAGLLTVKSPPISTAPAARPAAALSAPAATPVSRSSEASEASAAIAVVGMAGQFPQAQDLERFWRNIAEGVDCIGEVPAERWSKERLYRPGPASAGRTNSCWMGLLDDYDAFDPLFFNISPAEARAMDPQQRLFLQACWHAIEDANYDPTALGGSKCGVFVGAGVGDYNLLAPHQLINAQGFTGGATSILAARIAYFLNLQGPCITLDTACSASLVAIASACDSLTLGASDVALAGGVYVMAGPYMHIKTAQSGMLSPTGRCYAFDQRADGFVPGEGVGVMLLKRLADAERDGDTIHAVIRGWGVNQDGKTNGITAPSADSQSRLQTDVYRRFGIDPSRIELIEAHGTGTKLGDPIEIAALKQSFNQFTQRRGYCAVGSVKSNIGHCLAAAGAAGALKVALALKHRQLPPTVQFEQLNEHIDLTSTPFYISRQLTDWRPTDGSPRFAAVSSFGFSGTNAHLVFSDYQPEQAPTRPRVVAGGGAIVPLSAKTPEQLVAKGRDLVARLAAPDAAERFADIVHTLQVGRTHFNHRLCVVAATAAELISKLEGWLAAPTQSQADGVFASAADIPSDMVGVIRREQELRAVVDEWLQRGRLAIAAELWVKGLDLDWRVLYAGRPSPGRAPVPLYPFAKERYWLDQHEAVLFGSSPVALAQLHPLIHTNGSSLAQQCYRSVFTGDEPFLRDHRVMLAAGESKVLPGVAYLEMVRFAVGEALSEHRIEQLEIVNVAWSKPIAVAGATEVVIELDPVDGADLELDFGIGRAGDDFACRGRARPAEFGSAPVLKLDQLAARMTLDRYDGERIYQLFDAGGIHYGTSHRLIRTVLLGDGEALATLAAPPALAAEPGGYYLHHGLLDSALQASIALVESLARPALPFALDQLRIFGPATTQMWAWVRLGARNRPGMNTTKFDIDLLDRDGRLCVQFIGFSTRAAGAAAAVGNAFDDAYYAELLGRLAGNEISIDQAVELG